MLALLGGIIAYALTSNPETELTKQTKAVEKVKKDDPYEKIPKDKIDEVKIAKKAVDDVIKASEGELERKINDANMKYLN